ncbi:hypothetical protein C7447_102204 [Tenacibaculum adriaticum]|uniref:VOC domain-containing protein n=1 Tax=Tenacibaculum adriaticum TaxID=413713 RepID=A0A5S5DV15_9FLAO|nr:bleomycin resistance protein [Tenacibaculum adriaticum]TYP98886.1 hypothetical protein C7447_102204 [Tenacibaculum adriaticum]
MNSAFHLSLPCKNIVTTEKFYSDELGFELGRKTTEWIDVNLCNHQITFVLVDKFKFDYPNYDFDEGNLPSFHFGVILDIDSWEEMYNRINYWSSDIITKKTFLKGKSGEHSSFFIKDPNGYFIEFKSFIKEDNMFLM